MTNPGNYPPPVFNCPPQAPVLKPSALQWDTSEPSTFQAARDWNWFGPQPTFPQPPPPGPWNTYTQGNWHDGPWQQNFGANRSRGSHHKTGGQQYGRQDFGGKKKNKKEPEFSFFCDPCDRGFKHQDKYDEHLSQHVKCSVADCSFTAHEKLVKIHWRNNHAPGTKRIKLDTPEEIKKWREERRRNFPTLANVEKKMKLMEAKEERGEVLQTAEFGRMRGRGRGGNRRGGFRGRGRGRDSDSHSNYRGGAEEKQQQQQPVSQPRKEVDPLGTLANSDPDSEKEDVVSGETVSVAPKNMSAGLASLVASYGSMSESDQEPDAAPILKTSKVLEENKAMLKNLPAPSQPFQESSVPMERGPPGNNSRGRGRRRGRGGRHHNDTPQQRRHTLLEMLLAPDIRHERNVILQCVRFVVRNGFFGLERKGEDPAVTHRKQGTKSGAECMSQSENVISGNMQASQASQATTSQSPLKDLPQTKNPFLEHQPSLSNTRGPGLFPTGNGNGTEGSMTAGEDRHVSEQFRNGGSQAKANTRHTPSVYEDDVWEMDDVSTTDGDVHPSEACDPGLNESRGTAERRSEEAPEVSIGGAMRSQVLGWVGEKP
ncbi:nuclear fragile X mental retardation-interacting protein 1 [Clupea harengus]|uniref:Nuclear fragile X mental retardation-interacting protein 1 n=1 Tax=Clupea harengus TaxID=7950 RepID=A0A6P3VLM5_CLUHA|nr:nuclear fragile X mental retardation-interacting protein 1 [Clupea harengus]